MDWGCADPEKKLQINLQKFRALVSPESETKERGLFLDSQIRAGPSEIRDSEKTFGFENSASYSPSVIFKRPSAPLLHSGVISGR
ncbi:hypothetical protein PTTG_25844 [Puccinia triticina 1-1 BBBD Race 1]|uniref:Uncharacterized protein n=1 Tax=Puccinia triticina (isolate 1-1 / race 1 (BBBD)) TaxID=630390 RepID=A0A180GYC1_PUCT1|nr:hypothetical protein PTTG_25844 [Puccinia triticina 1-1 BBBD Race 1]